MASFVITQGPWHKVFPVSYGYQACAPGHTFGPAVRAHYLVHYVLEGKGTFLKNGKPYALRKGDLFVIFPGEVTTYSADREDPWKYSWLGFETAQLPEALNAPFLQEPPVRHIFTYIRDHLEGGDLDGKIFSLLYDFLWLLTDSDQKGKTGESTYAAYTRAFLENSYMLRISIEEIAQSLHINRRHLTAVFRKAYGLPPQEFLTRVRMEKAREFLEAGHSVSEAAVMSGYFDLPNFTRQYKARYGIRPSKIKK